MNVKLSGDELIKGQKQSQKLCVESLGNGRFTIEELEILVGELKDKNENLIKSCKKTTTIKTKSYGGTINLIKVPEIIQRDEYKNNQELIVALTTQINIAKHNNLKMINDFDFTDEQILEYGKSQNIII